MLCWHLEKAKNITYVLAHKITATWIKTHGLTRQKHTFFIQYYTIHVESKIDNGRHQKPFKNKRTSIKADKKNMKYYIYKSFVFYNCKMSDSWNIRCSVQRRNTKQWNITKKEVEKFFWKFEMIKSSYFLSKNIHNLELVIGIRLQHDTAYLSIVHLNKSKQKTQCKCI